MNVDIYPTTSGDLGHHEDATLRTEKAHRMAAEGVVFKAEQRRLEFLRLD